MRVQYVILLAMAPTILTVANYVRLVNETLAMIPSEQIVIVGEIVDEFDEEEKAELTKIGTMEVQATGKALIEDINKALKIRIPCPEHRTISYYITETLGRFPSRGETISGKGFRLIVNEMDKHTILDVTIEKRSRLKK